MARVSLTSPPKSLSYSASQAARVEFGGAVAIAAALAATQR